MSIWAVGRWVLLVSATAAVAILVSAAVSDEVVVVADDTTVSKEDDGTLSTIDGIINDGTLPNANGGTELMRRGLEARLPQIFLDNFSISSSRVRELPRNKKHILWLHDLPEDPESQKLKKRSFREQFSVIAFVSEWQKNRYEEYYGINFGPQAVVLRNAIRPFDKPAIHKSKEGPMQLIYHTTPHRGLEILIPAYVELYKKYGDTIHLNVYSSFAIYGWKQRDEPYLILFDQCRAHPGCTYHGYVPNDQVRDALSKAHIFAYPNIWAETSCIAVIEAMSAGCEVVTSQHAALPETLGGGKFGHVYPFSKEFNEHAINFLRTMDHTIQTYWDPESVKRRRQMSLFAANAYDWGFAGWSQGGRIEQWIQVLSTRMFELETVPHRSSYESDEMFSEALFVSAKRQEMRGQLVTARNIYLEALNANPRSSMVSIALGLLEMTTNIPTLEALGIQRLGAILSPSSNLLPPPEENSIVTHGAAIRVSYWHSLRHYEDETRSALDSAYLSTYPQDDCWTLFRASYMAHVPMSKDEASRNIALFHQRLDELLVRADTLLCDNVKNLHEPFSVAYYDLDFRDELEKWTKLYMSVYQSNLVVSAPSLLDNASLGKRTLESITTKAPLRIGVISSFFVSHSSIWGSFGKTVNSLQSNPLFDVDMIYYPRSPISEADKTLSLNPETNLYLSEFLPVPNDPNRQRARAEIAARRYDILVYLDLWMTMEMNELAVAKLAPIQMVTHGHPVTSGIPSHTMDYFISWSAAELPDPKKAQTFYTEELILLPGDNPWEYYEPRTNNGSSNIANGADFSHYTRESLASAVLAHDNEAATLIRDPSSVLYFCAQATFKLHLTFDKILSEIQRLDSNAVIVLIELKDILSHIHTKIKNRLEGNGVNMNRVVFIPRMQHDHLMAMYQNADVVLDSLYFGGDTTTREAFETGAPIITLPHKTIGQRWTQAYYKMMGVDDFIARDANHYAHLAVEVANQSPDAKVQVRERIQRLVHDKLFRRTDGAKYWADMILDVATRPRRWRWNDEKLQESEEITRDEL